MGVPGFHLEKLNHPKDDRTRTIRIDKFPVRPQSGERRPFLGSQRGEQARTGDNPAVRATAPSPR